MSHKKLTFYINTFIYWINKPLDLKLRIFLKSPTLAYFETVLDFIPSRNISRNIIETVQGWKNITFTCIIKFTSFWIDARLNIPCFLPLYLSLFKILWHSKICFDIRLIKKIIQIFLDMTSCKNHNFRDLKCRLFLLKCKFEFFPSS